MTPVTVPTLSSTRYGVLTVRGYAQIIVIQTFAVFNNIYSIWPFYLFLFRYFYQGLLGKIDRMIVFCFVLFCFILFCFVLFLFCFVLVLLIQCFKFNINLLQKITPG